MKINSSGNTISRWSSHLVHAVSAAVFASSLASASDVVHDAEYYVLEAQHGERWAAEDKELDAKLSALQEKFGTPPNTSATRSFQLIRRIRGTAVASAWLHEDLRTIRWRAARRRRRGESEERRVALYVNGHRKLPGPRRLRPMVSLGRISGAFSTSVQGVDGQFRRRRGIRSARGGRDGRSPGCLT